MWYMGIYIYDLRYLFYLLVNKINANKLFSQYSKWDILANEPFNFTRFIT